MRPPFLRLAVILASGSLAACTAARPAPDAWGLGTATEPVLRDATPDGSASRPHLADAVASLASAGPVAPSRARGAPSGTSLQVPSQGAGEPAAAPDAPAAADGDQELARKLANPIASLISVPFQTNWDSGMGPDGRGKQVRLNVQPVIPISVSEDWNLISRTIVPVIDQHEVVPGTGDQSGVGDITQSCFLSPKRPTESGWVWGAGPVFLVPTAEDDRLGGDQWGAGPTAVFLRQESGWTYGALVNHIWSFAGDSRRDEVSLSFVQPFVSYTTSDAWTFGVNAESTYDWLDDELGVPVNLTVAKLVRIGRLPVQFTVGTRYWAERTEFGPEGFGFRFALTILLPTGN